MLLTNLVRQLIMIKISLTVPGLYRWSNWLNRWFWNHIYAAPCYCLYNKNTNEFQFHTHIFMNIAPEWMKNLPQGISGMKIYKMKCLPRDWIQKSQDLRYVKMYSLRRKGLIGTRKVGRCIVNLYCPYQDCPLKLSTGGRGTLSTSRMWMYIDLLQVWTCCQQRKVWGKKMMGYCRESEILTIYQ